MTLLFLQLLRQNVMLWSQSNVSVIQTVRSKNMIVPPYQRSFLYMIAASTGTIGILSHGALLDVSDEKDVYHPNGTTTTVTNQPSTPSSYRRPYTDTFSVSSLLQSLCSYHRSNIQWTYCDSMNTTNSNSILSAPSSSSLTTESSTSSIRLEPRSDTETGDVPTGSANPTTKSNIQRQVREKINHKHFIFVKELICYPFCTQICNLTII